MRRESASAVLGAAVREREGDPVREGKLQLVGEEPILQVLHEGPRAVRFLGERPKGACPDQQAVAVDCDRQRVRLLEHVRPICPLHHLTGTVAR